MQFQQTWQTTNRVGKGRLYAHIYAYVCVCVCVYFWSSDFEIEGHSILNFTFFFKDFIHISEKGRAQRKTEREKQTPCWAESPVHWIPRPWDHDLRRCLTDWALQATPSSFYASTPHFITFHPICFPCLQGWSCFIYIVS